MSITINVTGTPAPQGSKRHVGNGIMVESSKKVAPWRQDVVAGAERALAETAWEVPAGPVRVDVVFYIARPRYHYRTGKRSNELRDNAPCYVDKKPDIDKLERSTFDALTSSGVIRDDAQIGVVACEKRYADGRTGARITITPLDSVAASTALVSSGAADVATDQQQGVLL